jgi:hypothetical protein
MRTIIVRTLVASALPGTGCGAAKAQVSEPTFELVVEAPLGARTHAPSQGQNQESAPTAHQSSLRRVASSSKVTGVAAGPECC